MKKLLLSIVVSALLFCINASANNDVRLIINESIITTDNDIFIDDGITFVPLRLVGEILGCAVEWEDSTQSINVFKDNESFTLYIGMDYVITMVPLRAIAELLHFEVEWLDSTYTVYINSPNTYNSHFSTTIKKQYDDREWVYNAYEFQDSYFDGVGNLNTFHYDVPAFNIISEDAKTVNSNIYTEIYKQYSESLSLKNDECSLWVTKISNNHYLNDDVISLCIETYTDFGYTAFETYNMNKTNGKIITNSELISRCGYTESEFVKKIKEITSSYYIENSKAYPKDKLYWNRYNYTISDEVCNINIPIFVGKNGNLFIIASIGSNAGSEAYEHIIDTEITLCA